MASQKDQHYSAEFKAKVALEALAQSKQNLDRLSEKYDMPVSLILTWAVQLERNAGQIYATSNAPEKAGAPEETAEEDTIVDVEVSNSDVSESIGFGVMHDDLNYKKLLYWSVMGIILIIIFAQLVRYMYDQTDVNEERLASNKEFYKVNIEKRESRKELSTFGVIDLDKGIYRIPIDTVIDEMAVDSDSSVETK